MNKIITGICLAACVFVYNVQAEPQGPILQKNKMSIGGGISRNTVDVPGNNDSEIGFQFFAAYDLDQVNLIEGARSSVELGYMDYGFSSGDAGGLWTTYVLDGAIRDNLGWLARLGLDLGDDSGIMLGAGLGFRLDPAAQLRLEYVIRDEIDSLQINFIYHL
ncbi:MAG: hypothetical protein HYZ31_10230 [Gammaproteobacteria bacterium]|jgi:hypothetical protein|nr:hypothetical protein [Gammaproteobacteria bacterium]